MSYLDSADSERTQSYPNGRVGLPSHQMCTPTSANPGEYPSPGDLLVKLDMDHLLATVYIYSATTRRV